MEQRATRHDYKMALQSGMKPRGNKRLRSRERIQEFPVSNWKFLPSAWDIPRDYECSNDHVTSVRNNSPRSPIHLAPSFLPTVPFFLSSISFVRLSCLSGGPRQLVPLVHLPLLRGWTALLSLSLSLSLSSTVYTADTLFRSLAGLVVPILSDQHTREHVLSSNDRNRNYAGPEGRPVSSRSFARANIVPLVKSVFGSPCDRSVTDHCHRTFPMDSYIYLSVS